MRRALHRSFSRRALAAMCASLLVIAATTGTAAADDCDDLEIDDVSVLIEYRVTDIADLDKSINLSFRGDDDDDDGDDGDDGGDGDDGDDSDDDDSSCQWSLWFGHQRELKNASTGDVLNFELYSATGYAIPPLLGKPKSPSPLTFVGGDDDDISHTETVRLVVGAGQFVKPGRYEATLPIDAYGVSGSGDDDDGGGDDDDDRGDLRITVDVVEFVSISVVGAEDVDFGNMTLGPVSKTIQVLVVSNGAYKLRFQSDNNSLLRHKSDTSAAGIRYRVYYGDGPEIDLSGGVSAVRQYLSPTTSFGDMIPLEFTVDQVTHARAGDYQGLCRSDDLRRLI